MYLLLLIDIRRHLNDDFGRETAMVREQAVVREQHSIVIETL